MADAELNRARAGYLAAMNAPTVAWWAMNARLRAKENGATEAEQAKAYRSGWVEGVRVRAEYDAHMQGVTLDNFDKRLKEWEERDA